VKPQAENVSLVAPNWAPIGHNKLPLNSAQFSPLQSSTTSQLHNSKRRGGLAAVSAQQFQFSNFAPNNSFISSSLAPPPHATLSLSLCLCLCHHSLASARRQLAAQLAPTLFWSPRSLAASFSQASVWDEAKVSEFQVAAKSVLVQWPHFHARARPRFALCWANFARPPTTGRRHRLSAAGNTAHKHRRIATSICWPQSAATPSCSWTICSIGEWPQTALRSWTVCAR